jgi:hypothetical protein
MALYTDGFSTTLTVLRSYDNSVLDVAAAENIDVSDKLRLAQRELGIEITNFLLRNGLTTEQEGLLGHAVQTEQMAHVHSLLTLALLFRDAGNSRLNDRYKAKWREYAEEADAALRRLFQTGIGMTLNPVPQAETPLISTVPGSVLPARTYAVSIAWVGQSGRAGLKSAPVLVEIAPGMVLSAAATRPPAGISGFVVLAGETEEQMTRQSVAVVRASETWREPTSGIRHDLPEWLPQAADYFVANRRQILRG